MISLEERLERVLKAHGLFCDALIEESGAVVSRVGDFEGYGDKGLVSGLLGPYGDPSSTFVMLEGLLPRMIGQGRHFAFIDRIPGNLAAVMFGRSEGGKDVAAEFQLSQSVHRTLAAVFAS